jgi:iron complex outermembrane receptor protein
MKMKLALLVSTSLAALAGSVDQVWAQTAPPESAASGLQEIVVTALKQKERLQETPSTVDVVTGDDVIQRGLTDIRGLANLAPTIELGAENASTQVFLRGIGQTSDADTNSPAVAVNMDGVYNPRFSISMSMFDVEQVEVLPGPQGLLYGRNAAGGAININTRTPGTTFETDGIIEVGNYGLFHGSAGMDLPLGDTFSIRAAVDEQRHDGYLSDGQDDADAIAGRLTALWRPSDALSVLVRGEIDHSGGNGGGVVPYPLVDPNNPWYEPTHPGDRFYNDTVVYKANAEISYALDDFTITYIPAFVYYDWKGRVPISAPALAPAQLPLAAAPFGGFMADGQPGGYFAAALEFFGMAQQQYSNELRFASNNNGDKSAGTLSWVGGLYQLLSDTHSPGFAFELYNPSSFFGGPTTPYLVQTGGGANFDHVVGDSYAGFGQLTYSATDWLRILGGARYSLDNQRLTGVIQTYLPSTPVSVVPFTHGALVNYDGVTATPATTIDLGQIHHNVDWKAGLEADITPDSMVYASAQTGYNEGGFNLIPLSTAANEFEPEKLLAFTVGSKNSFFNNRLRINDEAFYYDYKDLQVSAYNIAAGGAVLVSVPKSIIYGDQLDVTFKVLDDTVLAVSLAYLSAHIEDAVMGPATVYGAPQYPACVAPINKSLCSASNLINYSGFALPNAPPISAGASLDKIWDLDNGANLEGLIGTHFEGPNWGQYSHVAGMHRPGYTMSDLTLTYHSESGRWSLAAWVKNIENTARVETPATDSIYGQAPSFIQPPRTFGLRLGFKFGAETPSTPEAPPPAPPVVAPPPPPPAKVEAQREFQVFFDFDKSAITEAAAKVIRAAAEVVKSGGVARVSVTGHTDTVGSASYNQGLSERRATAVKAELAKDGVAADEISVSGVGKAGLLVPTADGVREPQNRRAVIDLK